MGKRRDSSIQFFVHKAAQSYSQKTTDKLSPSIIFVLLF